MTAFGLEWAEDDDGFRATHRTTTIRVTRGRGRMWKFRVEAPDWKAQGETAKLTNAQRFCALLVLTDKELTDSDSKVDHG